MGASPGLRRFPPTITAEAPARVQFSLPPPEMPQARLRRQPPKSRSPNLTSSPHRPTRAQARRLWVLGKGTLTLASTRKHPEMNLPLSELLVTVYSFRPCCWRVGALPPKGEPHGSHRAHAHASYTPPCVHHRKRPGGQSKPSSEGFVLPNHQRPLE